MDEIPGIKSRLIGDEIPGINSRLIGGTGLPSSSRNALDMLKKITGGAEEIRKRIKGGAYQAGKAAYENRDSIKDKLGGFGNKGKSVAPDSGGDEAKESGGGSDGGGDGDGGSDGGGDSGGGSDGGGENKE